MKNLDLLFIFVICFFLSCQSETTRPAPGNGFFDLKAFFNQEQEKLKDIKRVTKKASVDGKLEEKTVDGDEVNFEEELALFVDSDINKISWLDKYDADTVRLENGIKQITYLAKDEKLKTKSLVVHYENNQVNAIHIIRQTSSIAAALEQELIYTPSKGYSIKSHQEASFSNPHILELEVLFFP